MGAMPGGGRGAVLGALGLVLVLGALHLPTPLHGDQALAIVGARTVLDGGGLYGDAGYWDIRPPGVVLLHLPAVLLPGDDAVGARLLELAWLLGTALLALRALGPRLRSSAGAFAAVALVAGPQLALAVPQRLGQPESFAGGALLLACWGALPAGDGEAATWRRRFAAGIGAAAVLLLKHPYVAIPIACWAVTAWRRPGLPTSVLRWFVPVLAGSVAVLLPVGAWLAATGDLGDALWTLAVYAPRTAGLDERDPPFLVEMAKQGAYLLGPGLALVVALRRQLTLDPLVTTLLTWLVVATPLLLAQHWWGYLPMVLAVPVGLLAALAVDGVAAQAGGRRRVLVAGALLAVVPALGVARTGLRLADHGFGLGADDRLALLRADRPAVGEAEAWVATLDRAGPVYVLGDPIALYLADREVAASVHGWSPEFYDEELWRRLVDQLRTGGAVAVAADDYSLDEAAERGPGLLDLLEEDFCEAGGEGATTFFVPRIGPACEPG